MKPSLFAILSLSSFCTVPVVAPTSAYGIQGVGSSGGGKAVVCRNPKTLQVESAKLLDLYEATHKFGLQLRPPQSSMENELFEFLTNYNRSTQDHPAPVTDYDVDHITQTVPVFQFKKGELADVADVGSTVSLPTGCQLEQLAVYNDDTNKLFVDEEIWDSLDSMNRAALIAHELIYRQQRVEGGQKTSELARRLVGLLFSTTPTPSRQDLNLDNYPTCSASDVTLGRITRFFVDTENGSSKIYFDRIGGLLTIIPAIVTLPVAINTSGVFREFGKSIVADANANFQNTVFISNAPYEGFRISVTYKNNLPFALKIYDAENNIVTNATTDFCSASKRF